MDKETFDRTVDHLSKSLDNAQNTIRFIDTKVGVVVSVLSLALGGVFSYTSLPHYFLQLARDVSWPQVLSLLMPPIMSAGQMFRIGSRILRSMVLLDTPRITFSPSRPTLARMRFGIRK